MRLATAAVLVALSSSCVFSPLSDSPVQVTRAGVAFSGISPGAEGTLVTIQYARPRGTWTTLGSATVARDGSWSTFVDVPKDAWWLSPCNHASFRFVGTGGVTLSAMDARCVRALPADPLPSERLACRRPTLTLFQGKTHVGDLAISGQAEADAQYCVTRVQGDLAVDGGAVVLAGSVYTEGLTFDLPNLEEVTGSLSVAGNHTENLSMPALRSVGGDLSVTSTRFRAGHLEMGDLVSSRKVNAFAIPLLESVGGAVSLTAVNDFGASSGNVVHEFGLDAVTSVGTDVSLHGVFLTSIQGLRGLGSIPRDLFFDWGNSDLDSYELLPALTSVGRDAVFTLPPNARHGLHALEEVGRDVAIAPAATFTGLGADMLPALRTVGGAASLTSVDALCGPGRLPALETVAGTLTLQGRRPEAPLGATGATHLTVGGLAMSGTTSLRIPLRADARVAGVGPVSFDGNTGLCPCQIDAFTAALAAGGWGGVPVTGGNGGAASCGVCPAPACP